MRFARIVVEGAVGCLNELIADGEGFISDQARLPDSEASWITIPFIVCDRNVTEIVEFFSWVIIVDVG